MKKHFLAILASILATGCATRQNLDNAYTQGWRVADVQHIGTANDHFDIAGIDCRAASSATKNGLYAYVQFDYSPIAGKYFYHGPTSKHAIVPVPDGTAVSVGSQVIVNIFDCRLALSKSAAMLSNQAR